MKLRIIDVESIYRRLLTITNANERESIYRQELLAPFEGMIRVFGGGDPLALAKMWTLYTPEDFASETRLTIEGLVDGWRQVTPGAGPQPLLNKAWLHLRPMRIGYPWMQ
jgi:hypothetical protein